MFEIESLKITLLIYKDVIIDRVCIMKKEESPQEKENKDLTALKEMLDFEFYNFRIKTLAEKIKSETTGLKVKSINY